MSKGRREWMFWIPFIVLGAVTVFGLWVMYRAAHYGDLGQH